MLPTSAIYLAERNSSIGWLTKAVKHTNLMMMNPKTVKAIPPDFPRLL